MIDLPTQELTARARESDRQLAAPRVLLAEDDTEMRSLLASEFRKHRYDVVEAADGKELLDRLSDSVAGRLPIDCIVTDVRMPRLTGTEALRLIKKAGLVIPAVVITAFGDHTTRIEAWLLGAAAVLDKPFEIDDLLDELRRLGIGPGRGEI